MPKTYTPRAPHSEETKRKISEAMRARYRTSESSDLYQPNSSPSSAARKKAQRAEELHAAYLKLSAELLARRAKE